MVSIATNENIIYTIVKHNVTQEDFNELQPRLQNLIEEYRKVCWYYEMEDFDGWEVTPFFEDMEFSILHRNDFVKIAMVGEKKWQEWMTRIMKPFTSAEIKYFGRECREEAKRWIAGC